MPLTFGQMIADARKETGLSQKDLATRLRKEDGSSISPQYLNDVERGRRDPPSSFILRQLPEELRLPADYVVFMARELPDCMFERNQPPETNHAAFKVFRRTLKGR